MKKIMVLFFIVLMTLPCLGSFTTSIDNKKTYKNAYRWTGKPKDLLLDWAQEVEDRMDGTTGLAYLYYIPTATGSAPTATEGTMFYDSTTDTIKYRNASAWISLTGLAAGAAGTLDDSYNSGFAIDVDGSPVTMTVSDADDNTALAINQNEATNDNDALVITMGAGATGTAVEIDSQSSGTDIAGDSWSINQAGTLTLSDGEYIENSTTDDVIEFASNDKEDFQLDLSGTNIVGFSSGSSAVTLEFNALDKLTGIEDITFDAEAGNIILTADGGTEDLTISQAGAVDASLILTSAGTSTTDALIVTATTGSIDLNSGDNLDIDVEDNITIDTAGGTAAVVTIGGDITVDSTTASVNIDGGEADAAAVVIDASNAAGGIDMDCGSAGFDLTVTAGDLTLQNTTAKDIILDATAGRVLITGTESAADAIALVADGANGEILLQAAVGGVDIDGVLGPVVATSTYNAGNAVHIEENGGTSAGINIYSNQGTGVSAATEHDASIQLQSDAGGIGLYTTSNQGDDIRIEANGGTDENITIFSNQGTGADSITLLSDVGGIAATASAGGIVLTATGAEAGDLTISAGDVMNVTHVDKIIFSGATAETWEVEGTADDHEASVVFTDPTADITWTFPTGATDTLAVMGSTLATNVPETVNSVTGGSNTLVFEGTADAHETTLTANDATADATLSLPDDTGDVLYAPAGAVDYAAGSGALPITHVQITYASQGGAEALTIADGQPGQILQVNHDSDGGNGVITPTTATGYTSIDLADDGDMVTFMFVDTVGWIIIGTAGNAAPPAVTP